MDEKNAIRIFEDKKIRTAWDEEQEEWYFSVQDVVAVLAESSDPKQYIKKMRARDPELSANWGTICTPVQMSAADGKMRKIQAADTEGLLRIIQSIPSPKAEPFKRWLAKVGRERIEETIDPEQAIDRALETYQKKGYDTDWIHQRLLSIRVRNELTAEWQERQPQNCQKHISRRAFLKVRRLPAVAAAMPVRFDKISKKTPGVRSSHRRTPHNSMP